MRLILVFLFTLSLTPLFSQSQSGTNTIFKIPKSGESVKIIFDVSDYTSNQIGEFKDVLITYKNQILRAHYDDLNNLFTLTYNENIKITTLIDIFNEYNISYTTKINPELNTK